MRTQGKRDVTDDSELVERSGVLVSVVLTSRWNLKITYPEDLAVAEAFLARKGA
jgi:2-C-methyl-D-erythritol 4-phosphate cytidylyltransferase